jgi:hypothetical protein
MPQFRDPPQGRRRHLVYNLASHRLRELERIIRARHGSLLDTDDADVYLVPVAQTLRRIYGTRNHSEKVVREAAHRL